MRGLSQRDSMAHVAAPWRDAFSRQLARALAAVFSAVAVVMWFTVHGSSQRVLLTFTAAIGAVLTGVPALAGWPAGRVRDWLIVVPTLLGSLAGYATVGFVSGPAVVMSLTLLLSGMLLGPRAMLVLAGLAVAALSVIATGMIRGELPLPEPMDVSVGHALPWVRTLTVTFLATGLLGVIMLHLIARLEHSLASTMAEAERREQAEVARRRTEIAALEAKQLETIGRLSAVVAHDFNNQLTAIMGCAHLLEDAVAGNPQDAVLVEEIQGAARRAAQLTAQLLAYSCRAQTVLAPTDVHGLIVEAVALARRSAKAPLVVTTRLDAALPTSPVDATLMYSAILNVLLNACDAMPDGGKLTITTHNETVDEGGGDLAPGPYLVLEIADTGTGIPAEALPRIFDPFFTTKPLGKGTGLGLAAVAGTVKAHRGALEVRSEPGEGTMFRIKLPLDVTGSPAVGAPHPELVRGSGRILVVDDEPAVRDSAVALLSSLGYEPSAAPDGDAAVARLREDPGAYDLVVLDLRMPGGGGEATFDRLRQLAPGLRVILWSGYGGDADVEGILRRGALAFVQKPYQVDEFSRVVRAALER